MFLTSAGAAPLIGAVFAFISLYNAQHVLAAASHYGVHGDSLPLDLCLGGPLTGRDYLAISNFPDPEDDTQFIEAARSRVQFRVVFDNLYAASGYTNSTLDPTTVNLPVNLLAIFDPETCILSGSGFNFDLRLNDVFKLTFSTPEQANGPYASLVGDTVIFKRFGRFDVTLEA